MIKSIPEYIYDAIHRFAEENGYEADDFPLSDRCKQNSISVRWLLLKDGRIKFEFIGPPQ